MITLDIRPGQQRDDGQSAIAAAEQAGPDQSTSAAPSSAVGFVDIHPSHEDHGARETLAGVEQPGTDHRRLATHAPLVGSDVIHDDHTALAAQRSNVVVEQSRTDHSALDAHGKPVGASTFEYAVLALAADTVDDLEKTRIAAENRLRHLTRDAEDTDGEVRGLALDDGVPEVRALRRRRAERAGAPVGAGVAASGS